MNEFEGKLQTLAFLHQLFNTAPWSRMMEMLAFPCEFSFAPRTAESPAFGRAV